MGDTDPTTGVFTWPDTEDADNEPIDVPTPEPHPNEVATRAAVASGVYAAEDVGVEPNPS
jgi:hypothetical protein